MPKRSLLAQARPESGSGEYVLGTWRAAALSMAVIAPAAWYGLGALLGAAVMIPVIYALARLRRHAPQARSTAELIGAMLGRKAGTAAGIVQLLAYLVLAAQFAATLGLQLLQLLSPGDDPAAIVSWLPVGAAARRSSSAPPPVGRRPAPWRHWRCRSCSRACCSTSASRWR